jgi:hypothetical protein
MGHRIGSRYLAVFYHENRLRASEFVRRAVLPDLTVSLGHQKIAA